MDVYEAVRTRRAVRGFMNRPVDREVIERVLFCGMSIGYEDPSVSFVDNGRASLDETVTVIEG